MARGNKFDNPMPPPRNAVRPGVQVWVIEKDNYGTKNYKQGIVKNVLTSAAVHPRGIKVRLTDSTIGRVQWLVEE
ncbi:MAG: YwbE family protein [bacterium]